MRRTVPRLALWACLTFWLGPALFAQTNQWAGSQSCRSCHEHFYQLWSTSFHGLAMQPYSPELARTKLTPQKQAVVAGKYRFMADLGKGDVVETSDKGENRFPMVQAMGGKNVFYFLTPLDRGWLQVLPVAYDVRRKEWFDTTASAMRHFGDRRDEALYWKERPLTFNTSCFGCHVSQLAKNYELATDSYHTTWAEPGINCETCHGPSLEHARFFRTAPTNQPPPADLKLITMKQLTTAQHNDLCGSCHAKMAPVTASFNPGNRFFDGFDLIAFEHADFYPDGRDLGENYTFTQWKFSPCAKAGKLDCIHCHTSSGRYRFAEAGRANNACLPCHAERVRNAKAHTHHEEGSPGSQCVACHMPTTEFARMRRSDHSMRPPTPATTIAYQSPNACNLCHTNKDARWADELVRQWSKTDYQKPVLERSGLIAAARKQDWKKLPDILAYLRSPKREEVQTVSLVRLVGPCPSDEKWPVLRQLLNDGSPWVRAAAAEALGERPEQENLAALVRAASDSYRLVRVRAATGVAAVPEESIAQDQRPTVRAALAEAMESLNSRPDEMTAHYNLGNLHMARGKPAEAVKEFETATRLNAESLPPLVNLALAYNALGQNDKAEASLRRALRLEPTNVVANLNLGMLLGELGKMSEAEEAFRAAFKADPRSAQAAYNLGVILSRTDAAESLTWCRRAAELAPANPEYGYTYAFFLYQAGRLEDALQAVRAVRQRYPSHEDSAALEQELVRAKQAR